MIQSVVLLTAVTFLLIIGWTIYGRFQYHQLLQTIEVVILHNFYSQHLNNHRPIHIYLPPNYRKPDSTTTYQTLYLNDGQDAAHLKLRETLARLMARGQIAPIIVVAIPTNKHRLQEYGTAVTPNASGYGSRAAAYAQFVTQELMPVIERDFAVKQSTADRTIMGISLGGLSAFDIAWNHPHLFGTVGIFSGSFWWHMGQDGSNNPPYKRITHEMVRNGRYSPNFRAWFEAATRDETGDRDNDGIIDAIQDTLELIDELEKIGHHRGQSLIYCQIEGGRHNYHTWAQHLPHFLKWAFPLPSL